MYLASQCPEQPVNWTSLYYITYSLHRSYRESILVTVCTSPLNKTIMSRYKRLTLLLCPKKCVFVLRSQVAYCIVISIVPGPDVSVDTRKVGSSLEWIIVQVSLLTDGELLNVRCFAVPVEQVTASNAHNVRPKGRMIISRGESSRDKSSKNYRQRQSIVNAYIPMYIVYQLMGWISLGTYNQEQQ